jgi:TonB family protein
MQDPVADVLTQRAALDHGATPAVFLSILLHGAVAGMAIYAATSVPAQLPRTAVKIQFAASRMPQVAERPSVSKPTPVVEKPKAPRIDAPKPEPVKPVKTTAPPEKNAVPLSPFGQSTKKGSENPEPPKPTTNNQPPTTASVAIGAAGVTGLEGGDFPYTIYIERMTTLIGSRWLRPQSASGTPVVIYFEIQRDGQIRNVEVETRSGNGTFDRAAQRAVMEASPLPPLPFAYNGTYLGVHLTFR